MEAIHDFLPISKEDMKRRGIDRLDFVYVCGDAYVDHPSFGHAIITRLLESYGYSVGIIAQPDWKDDASISVLGEPRLGFLVSGGNMDSMVNHYSVSKKRRQTDAFSPGGVMGKRPDYASIVYCNLIRRTYKRTPIIIGGIEGSLRRLAHYDYWSNKVKRSILMDSGADLISYGMGERSIIEIAEALAAGIDVKDITYIRGTVFRTQDPSFIEDAILLPSYEEISTNKEAYAKSFYTQYLNTDHFSAKLTSGGSSKVKIECQKVIVKNGKATAWINFSSSKYDKVWVKVNGTQNIYHAKPREGEAGVTFEIPVNLNSSMTFMAHTSSMSGKNIAYTINIAIPEDTVPSTPSTPDQTVITELSFKEGSELSMKEGEVQELTPQFTPALSASETAPDMTWTSSDPKIVTVAKSGTQAEVTAVKAGTAEVTVSINNAEGTELKATCKVTVTASETENKTLTDGNYQVDVDTGNKMFKVTNCILTSEKGKMYAVITLSGTGYDYLYMGSAADAAEAAAKDYISYVADEAGKYTYKVPVESLDKGIAVAAHSIKKDKWYDRTLIFSSASAKRIIADGTYQVNAEAGGKMFRVTDCVMTVKNGQMTAAVTLSGQGYNRIYLGDVNNASDDEKNWILPDSLLAEQYTFQIPVKKLDEVMTIAVHTTKSNKWDTRTLTFHSEGMTKIADSNNGNASNGNNGSNGSLKPGGNNNNPGNGSNGNNQGNAENNNGNSGTTGNNTTNNGKPDQESKYESDLNKSTARVNSTTGLKDGVYAPDSFSWSGGTGKVSITCSKVTVTGGQAYATITFSSPHYQYVKANGNVYYPSAKTGSSTSFVIPVELNKNNSVVGMTTAMSTAHEIKYTIFVYIAEAAKANASARANGKEVTVIGANGSDSSKTATANKKMDEVAPEIIGLEYQSETKAEYAKYFKIYHYDQGITLLEIDMNKKTGRKAAGKKWKEASEISGLNPAEQEQAALYLNKVIKCRDSGGAG